MLVNGNQARTSEQLCEIERGEGGGHISNSILGWDSRDIFILTLYNFKNMGGGGRAPVPSPLLRGSWK